MTTARRMYFATPVRLYAAAAFRVAMGLVVILGATDSRTPKILRVLGAVMCMQGCSAALLGAERARAVLVTTVYSHAPTPQAGCSRQVWDEANAFQNELDNGQG